MADEGKDLFAEIASGYSPENKHELEESAPLSYTKSYFQNSGVDSIPVPRESYEEQLARFATELKRMKEQYTPFLADFTPQKTLVRERVNLPEYQFRYETEDNRRDFRHLWNGEGEWESIAIPDYRGPVGRWTGYYRTEFDYGLKPPNKRIYLRFQGVDYIANVYLNGRHIGSHEGIFAPFEFDVTDTLKETGNILLVAVTNDHTTLGTNDGKYDGDKIYACNCPGWDDPAEGWHDCPPGAGIYNQVYLETRSPVFIGEVFARPLLDEQRLEAWIWLNQADASAAPDLAVEMSIYPRNFAGATLGTVRMRIESIGYGSNEYRYRIDMKNCRIWEPEHPWLYVLRVQLLNGQGELLDETDISFGMRKFHMEADEEPKGTLYLNNRPILLRGANEMGHLQQCVMRENWDQLVEDILMAKTAHMNYWRITQRPVQEEIYDYFDRLGMMHQCDFPLFGYLRRNQFVEAVRQAGEMERLIRSHPSSIMISYINEPFSVVKQNKGHRHLYRHELESFFETATAVVRLHNPDRVVKHVEGDYEPPTGSGLSDFHCYNCWYTNHALPIGKMYRGYLPATKKGWKTGCGEYGTEGLDPLEVMLEDYPEEWLPLHEEDEWTPEKIVDAQAYSMHGDWYEEQRDIKGWIAESQKHQAFATKEMSEALRRRSDRVVSTAVHLLIDAWPAGWMKTLMDHRRKPKPAYFAFQRSMKPVRVNLRCDRWKVYEGETLEVEAWLLNDSSRRLEGEFVVTLRDREGRSFGSYKKPVHSEAVLPTYAGTIPARIPGTGERKLVYLDAVWTDSTGNVLDLEQMEFEVFPRCSDPGMRRGLVYLGADAGAIAAGTGWAGGPYRSGQSFDAVVISSQDQFRLYEKEIMEQVDGGARALFLHQENGQSHKGWEIGGQSVCYAKSGSVFFLARDREHPVAGAFRSNDFSFWYNGRTDYIDFLSESCLADSCDGFRPLLFGYKKPEFFKRQSGSKEKRPVVAEKAHGQGKIIVSSLCMAGRQGFNPVLDHFLAQLLGS